GNDGSWPTRAEVAKVRASRGNKAALNAFLPDYSDDDNGVCPWSGPAERASISGCLARMRRKAPSRGSPCELGREHHSEGDGHLARERRWERLGRVATGDPVWIFPGAHQARDAL